jgi:ribosomal protein L7/L12
MSGLSSIQEQQIKELAAKGNKIAAIARFRELTGVSLKEAKDAVEAMVLGTPVNFPVSSQANDPDPFLENRIKRLLAERKKIEAVKIYREAHQCGLKEAKDAVDQIQVEMRKDGYSNLPSAPAISDDPFAAETQADRKRLLIFVGLVVVILGGLALLYFLRGGV